MAKKFFPFNLIFNTVWPMKVELKTIIKMGYIPFVATPLKGRFVVFHISFYGLF